MRGKIIQVIVKFFYILPMVPFAIAHALMDGASVLIGVLLPLLTA